MDDYERVEHLDAVANNVSIRRIELGNTLIQINKCQRKSHRVELLRVKCAHHTLAIQIT